MIPSTRSLKAIDVSADVRVLVARAKSMVVEHLEYAKGKAYTRGLNRWLYSYYSEVYMRVTRRLAPGQSTLLDTLDLASISVNEDMRGKGFTTTLVNELEHLCDEFNLVFHVEQVLSEDMAKIMDKRIGYTVQTTGLIDLAYWRFPMAYNPNDVVENTAI